MNPSFFPYFFIILFSLVIVLYAWVICLVLAFEKFKCDILELAGVQNKLNKVSKEIFRGMAK